MLDRKKLVKVVGENYNNAPYSKLYISKNIIDALDIEVFGRGNIFKNINGDHNGFLIFHDMVTNANWSHECEYIFVTLDNKIYRKQGVMSPPDEDIELEEIKGQNIYIYKSPDEFLYTRIDDEIKVINDINEFISDNKEKNIFLVEYNRQLRNEKIKVLNKKKQIKL